MPLKPTRPYIDFYRKYKISPVAQDISDFKRHYERRESLYHHLGIIPSFLKGKSIIEFGPGSGYNSLYTYSLHPSRYVLVDGNPTGLNECERLFMAYFPSGKGYELIESLIEEFKSNDPFDLVLCEGLLPAQSNSKAFLSYIAQFTKPGGICVITCHDVVSYFSELLRCLIGSIHVKEEMLLEEKVAMLLPVFEKHFVSLKGMTRSHKDWIVDNVIHTSLWKESSLLSIEDAIHTLEYGFDVYGSSPHFFTDWRWYKEVFGENKKFNETGIDCYRRNIHNLLDCRYIFEPRSVEDNMYLASLCHDVWRLIKMYGHDKNDEYVIKICHKILDLESAVRPFSPPTADALQDVRHGLLEYPDITPKTDWKQFASWWGRGMQYLSFIRHS